MKLFKLGIQIIIGLFLLNTSIHGAQASAGIITFTQADGSTFEGTLHGNSAFNWIQSNGSIVKYNNKDKFYYITTVDNNGTMHLSNIKAGEEAQQSAIVRDKEKTHHVSKETQDKLHNARIKLYKQNKHLPQ
ncbi:hypothetical protein MNB_SM-4-1211 [hydrothermal vent metagenome]|uniref:Uncharacterized protein n=1 Tax=hydrothermal vent metagenome TaxID=652676 RepID=A0A1W1CLI8_9ZZZZ